MTVCTENYIRATGDEGRLESGTGWLLHRLVNPGVARRVRKGSPRKAARRTAAGANCGGAGGVVAEHVGSIAFSWALRDPPPLDTSED